MAESAEDRAQTKNDRKPLLELSTLAPERPYITIDGQRYEMVIPDDFGLIEQARLQRLGRQVDDMRLNERDVTEEEATRLGGMLREMVATVMPSLPEDVAGRLTDTMCLSIVTVFTEAAGLTPPKKNRRARRRTGASLSPASSASTAAGRATG